MLRTFRYLLVLTGMALCAIFPGVVMAQATPLIPPYVSWGGSSPLNPSPVSIIGYDTVSGLACILGAAPTCASDRVPFVAGYTISGANAAQAVTYPLRNAASTLSISAVCSAGSATVTVAASPDNTHFITLDSISAAASTVKLYTATTVGVVTALSPLSFPFVTVTIGACGAGSTSTLIVGAK